MRPYEKGSNKKRKFDSAAWARLLERHNKEVSNDIDGHQRHLRDGIDSFRHALNQKGPR